MISLSLQKWTSHLFGNFIFSVFCWIQNGSMSFPSWKGVTASSHFSGIFFCGGGQTVLMSWIITWKTVSRVQTWIVGSGCAAWWGWRLLRSQPMTTLCELASFWPALFPKGSPGVELFQICDSASRRSGLRIHVVYLVRRNWVTPREARQRKHNTRESASRQDVSGKWRVRGSKKKKCSSRWMWPLPRFCESRRRKVYQLETSRALIHQSHKTDFISPQLRIKHFSIHS